MMSGGRVAVRGGGAARGGGRSGAARAQGRWRCTIYFSANAIAKESGLRNAIHTYRYEWDTLHFIFSPQHYCESFVLSPALGSRNRQSRFEPQQKLSVRGNVLASYILMIFVLSRRGSFVLSLNRLNDKIRPWYNHSIEDWLRSTLEVDKLTKAR